MTAMLDVNRRELLRLAQGALLLPVPIMLSGRAEAAMQKGSVPATLNIFLLVAPSGDVQIICHRSEMGQQVRTSMSQLIAEELEADWSRVSVLQAEGDQKYGDQRTNGSQSVRRNFDRLRKVGAAARLMLERAAAETWNVPASECRGRLHQVVHQPSGRRLGYGELAAKAGGYPVPEVADAQLKPRSEWRLIGRPVPSPDLEAIVTGRAQFGLDVDLPDMRYAVIARTPQIFGAVESFDREAAMAVPGVEAIVEIPAPTAPAGFKPQAGIGVIARSMSAALKGREKLAVRWKNGPHAGHDSKAYQKTLLGEVVKPGRAMRREGDPDGVLAKAERVVTAEYLTPYLAHAPIETPCAVARVTAEGAEVWAPVQSPQNVRGSVARLLAIDPSKVRINVPLLGGAFGRKDQADFASEAVLLAKETGGKPVKLLWTRGDDIKNGYYHATSCQRLDAAIDKDKVVAWRHRTAFPSINSIFSADPPFPQDWEMSQGVIDTPFNVPNISGEAVAATPPVRVSWLRGVAAVFHAFATNSFVGELAHALGREQKAMFIDLLMPRRRVQPTLVSEAKYGNYDQDQDSYPIDTGRIIDVIEAVTEMSGWARERPKGVAQGLAFCRSSAAYVATVVEVDTRGDRLRIPAIYAVMDAGTIVNPDHSAAQCEGGTIFGLSCALGEITVRDGKIEQSSLRDFEVCRMNTGPEKLEVRLLQNNHAPGGVGEPATPPVAAALCNAIFAATGQRIRQLPVKDQWRPQRA